MSDLPISDLTVDLTRLPAPDFVVPQSFEEIRDARLTDLQQRWPAFDALVESDPAIKLIEAGAYREVLIREAVNDAGRATLLAHAIGADLDQVTARFGTARLVVTPATDDAPAELEDDASLRDRARLAPERLAAGGLTPGGIAFIARTAAPSLRDVGIVKRGPGRLDVVLLDRAGTASAAAIAAVDGALSADDVASLTDVITVRSAAIVAYHLAVRLRIRPGPDPEVVRRAAEASIRAYAAERFRVGQVVYARMLVAAAAVGGVEEPLIDRLADVDPGPAGAARLGELVVIVEVIR